MRAARNVYAIIRVSRLDPGLVQTRSWIADAGDSYDRVADRYADMVARYSTSDAVLGG